MEKLGVTVALLLGLSLLAALAVVASVVHERRRDAEFARHVDELMETYRADPLGFESTGTHG